MPTPKFDLSTPLARKLFAGFLALQVVIGGVILGTRYLGPGAENKPERLKIWLGPLDLADVNGDGTPDLVGAFDSTDGVRGPGAVDGKTFAILWHVKGTQKTALVGARHLAAMNGLKVYWFDAASGEVARLPTQLGTITGAAPCVDPGPPLALLADQSGREYVRVDPTTGAKKPLGDLGGPCTRWRPSGAHLITGKEEGQGWSRKVLVSGKYGIGVKGSQLRGATLEPFSWAWTASLRGDQGRRLVERADAVAGVAYVPLRIGSTGNATVRAVSMKTGEAIWQVTIPDSAPDSPTEYASDVVRIRAAGDELYVASAGGVFVLQRTDGSLLRGNPPPPEK